MEFNFDSLDNFVEALSEVEILILSAQENEQNKVKYLVYNKSSVLLLAAKFENFIEQVVAEYIEHVNSIGMFARDIPESLKIAHSLYKMEKINEIMGLTHRYGEMLGLLDSVSEVWKGQGVFADLEVSSKFNYGKHGEVEVVKLFKNIGLTNVFEEVVVKRATESLLTDASTEVVDFKGKFNSLNGLRNNIIHQDATPNITHGDIQEHKQLLESFAKELVSKLFCNLNDLLLSRKSVGVKKYKFSRYVKVETELIRVETPLAVK